MRKEEAAKRLSLEEVITVMFVKKKPTLDKVQAIMSILMRNA